MTRRRKIQYPVAPHGWGVFLRSKIESHTKASILASELLLDLSEIDLTETRISSDEIGKYIPQEGDMRQLDRIVWVSDAKTTCVAVKKVRDNEFWVPGHLPGRPLLPGVMMIEAAGQSSSVLYRVKTGLDQFIGFIRCDDAVFRAQVVPGDTLYIISKEIEFKRRRFITLNQGILNNKLVFEAKITGMLM